MDFISLIDDKNRIEGMLYNILESIIYNPDYDQDLIIDFFDSSSVFMRNFSRLIDRAGEIENE